MKSAAASQKKPLQEALFASLKVFFSSAEGKRLVDRAKEKKLDIADVNKIHSSLVAQDPSLKNVLGMPILLDVINGTAGQQLVNAYQRTYLDSHQIPDSKLLLVGNNPLIGSRFLPQAVPFDNFLSKHFLPEGTKLADVRNAAGLVNRAGKGEIIDAAKLAAARQLLDRPALGWKGMIQHPDTALDKLLDESVFLRPLPGRRRCCAACGQ